MKEKEKPPPQSTKPKAGSLRLNKQINLLIMGPSSLLLCHLVIVVEDANNKIIKSLSFSFRPLAATSRPAAWPVLPSVWCWKSSFVCFLALMSLRQERKLATCSFKLVKAHLLISIFKTLRKNCERL